MAKPDHSEFRLTFASNQYDQDCSRVNFCGRLMDIKTPFPGAEVDSLTLLANTGGKLVGLKWEEISTRDRRVLTDAFLILHRLSSNR